jgi:hypothetical protein
MSANPQDQAAPAALPDTATAHPSSPAKDPEASEARVILVALVLGFGLMLTCGLLNFVARLMGW